MRRYRTGAYAKYDLKVHIAWVPKYRKRIPVSAVAVRVRDLLRQYINEQEGEPMGDDSRFQIDST